MEPNPFCKSAVITFGSGSYQEGRLRGETERIEASHYFGSIVRKAVSLINKMRIDSFLSAFLPELYLSWKIVEYIVKALEFMVNWKIIASGGSNGRSRYKF